MSDDTDLARIVLDRLELIELANRYGKAVDTMEWERLDTVFTDDAEADYTAVIARSKPGATTVPADGVRAGRDQIKAWLAAARKEREPLMHFMTNHIVEELDGDRARTWHYVHERQGAYGHYDIEAVRTPHGWRIQRLVLDLVPRPSKLV